MSSAPSGFNYLITSSAQADIDALDMFNQMRLRYALETLLLDPTVRNPAISEQTNVAETEPQFVLRLRDLAVYFDLLNPLVAAIRRVRIEP